MAKTYRHYTFETPKVKVTTEKCYLKHFDTGKIQKIKSVEILYKENNRLDVFMCFTKKQLKKYIKKIKKL